jgi:hypothetical protein
MDRQDGCHLTDTECEHVWLDGLACSTITARHDAMAGNEEPRALSAMVTVPVPAAQSAYCSMIGNACKDRHIRWMDIRTTDLIIYHA